MHVMCVLCVCVHVRMVYVCMHVMCVLCVCARAYGVCVYACYVCVVCMHVYVVRMWCVCI